MRNDISQLELRIEELELRNFVVELALRRLLRGAGPRSSLVANGFLSEVNKLAEDMEEEAAGDAGESAADLKKGAALIRDLAHALIPQ